MANTRELSQLASLINVVDSNKSIGIANSTSSFVGVGTTSPRSKVDIIGDVLVSGIVTSSSGRLISGIGIQSSSLSIGSGITTLNFVGTGNTFAVNGTTVDISISGGGSVSIGTQAPTTPKVGDLWFSSNHGRTFIYYEDNNSTQWVDASPSNVGVVTSSSSGGATVSISTVAPTLPNTGDLWFNPNYGKTFIYYVDNDSFQWIDAAPSNVGIITTADLATNAQGLTGTPNIVVGIVTSDISIPTQLRTKSVAEKTTLVSGNTVGLSFTTGGGNVAICTNPTGDITLNVTSIPTDSSFDNHSISFSVIVTQTGTARTCTAVNLNGVSRTIRWSNGSLANAISGVTTSNGYDIFTFTGINTVGSASTTANYVVLGSVNGGFN